MLLHLSEDQEFFRETTDRFLNELVPPDAVRALRHDEAGFERTYWSRGAELGWTSLLVSEEHGGGTISGAGLVDLSLVAYAFGRHAAPGPLAATNIVASALERARRGPRRTGVAALGRGNRQLVRPGVRAGRMAGHSRRDGRRCRRGAAGRRTRRSRLLLRPTICL